MNKYTELSDFEINKRLAEINTENRYIYFEKEQTIFRKFNNGKTQKFNPCNYPADVMPIIIENEISIIKSSGSWMYCHGSASQVEHENLYHGAMELFLLMKDAENENNNDS